MDRIHRGIDESIIEDLIGWDFDVDALESEGAFSLSPPKGPRAFSTNVSNDPPIIEEIPAEQWCEYAGMPSPRAYMKG